VTKVPLSEYDYDAPEELIAARPAEPRDSSRMLVIGRAARTVEHAVFRELPRFLKAGDLLVLNRTKVMPCRLIGKKSTGGKADLLLVRERGPAAWSALASGFKAGQKLEFAAGMTATVKGLNEDGEYELEFDTADLRPYLAEHGAAPLPPYIAKKKAAGRDADDLHRYQTVYARDEGSIAAPTAGLHFTDAVFAALRDKGVGTAYVTLHVGRGTFRPIKGEDAAEHVMLPESYEVDAAEAEKVTAAKAKGGRVIAVGTTATRTLETLARRPGGFSGGKGESSLYITPGFEFKMLDGLLTNFHLPRSTPLMLAAAFAGKDLLLSAYREAVARKYRLYSYGDATLIL
jgi:S-adenosylmethionine:tRNA ribosyltransferase-isomerase